MRSDTSDKSTRLSKAVLFFRCFNVAAITALAVWHGYLFYLNHASARLMELMPLESYRAQDNCCLHPNSFQTQGRKN